MSKINSLSGLNTVPVDYRPEIGQAAQNAPAANANPAVIDEPGEEGKIRPRASGIVRELDVLLLNAAGKSVSADASKKVKTIGETLSQKGVLTDREAAKLQSLAKDAADKLKALDSFSGTELARALMMDKTDNLVWRKGFFSLSDTARAVKAAVEAQEALSQALGEFIGRLATNDNVDRALQEDFMELQFQADRRATEIYSVVVRMYDLAQQDVVNGINDDPKIRALFSATFSDLMPREAIMMHGTAEALALMNEKLGKQMRPLAEKLEAFKANGGKILATEEIAALESDMMTMKNTLENVRKNGIEMENGTLEVDKSLLDAMERVLDDAAKDIADARLSAALKVRYEFVEDVRRSFSIELTPEDRAAYNGQAGMNSILNNFTLARKLLVETFAAVASGKIPVGKKANQQINAAALEMTNLGLNRDTLRRLGFSDKTAKTVCDHIDTLFIIKAQFHEMMKNTREFAKNGVGGATAGFDVRRIFLGEKSLSSAVDAKIRGFKPEDVNPATDDANVVDSSLLGKGESGSAYLVTTKSGEEFVFKPELEGRLGLGHLVIANGTAFSCTQTTANLNLATQDAAKMLGCEDVVVKCSVGNHNGQFGIFMEKAKGATGYQFANKENVSPAGCVNPSQMKNELTSNAENAKIRGKIAQKLNRLQWLDMVTGQMDRHWENYFIHIDKTSHEVTVKGIDCDASFTTFRTGLQRYALDKFTSEKFRTRLTAVCKDLHTPDNRKNEYDNRVKVDPGITWHDDGKVTVDVSRVESPEVIMALQGVLGSQSLAIPEVMDEGVYNHLMELDEDPAKKQAYLDSIAPRLSEAALAAARTRLEAAIACAKVLKKDGRVYGENEWNAPLKVGRLANIKKGVQITCLKGPKITKYSDDNSHANLYVINMCPSYFNRDYIGKVLPK